MVDPMLFSLDKGIRIGDFLKHFKDEMCFTNFVPDALEVSRMMSIAAQVGLVLAPSKNDALRRTDIDAVVEGITDRVDAA